MAVSMYTDGACSGNPGPGGWAFLILKDGKEISESDRDVYTTNNRMELIAVVKGLEYIIKNKIADQVIIYTDSRYISDNVNSLDEWEERGWKTKAKTPVKNKDLWIEIKNKISIIKAEFVWVKAHKNNKYNNKVDKMAVAAISKN